MSTRERVVGMLDELTEEQLEAIAVILSGMAAKSPRKKASDVKGILHRFANPTLIASEDGAWERDIEERAGSGNEGF